MCIFSDSAIVFGNSDINDHEFYQPLATNYIVHYTLCTILFAGFVLNDRRPDGDPAVQVIEQFEDKLKQHQVRCTERIMSSVSLVLFIYCVYCMCKFLAASKNFILHVSFPTTVSHFLHVHYTYYTTSSRRRGCGSCGTMCWEASAAPPRRPPRYVLRVSLCIYEVCKLMCVPVLFI